MTDFAQRFERQTRFAPLGAAGQARLQASSALLVGCGALGGSLAQMLARSGVGRLVIVDRDVVDLTNLPRQVLFEERHVGRAKVEAALETLARIGGPTRCEAHAVHVDHDNLPELATGCDLILDGTDNLSTRYLINDFAVERGLPWIYGGVVGASGLVMPVIPGKGACLRCVFPDPPPPGSLPTCDTVGVLMPAVAAIAAVQAGAALRWLGGDGRERESIEPALIEIDVWELATRQVAAARDPSCPCCGERRFEFLDQPVEHSAVALCGRNTVQIRPQRSRGARVDLAGIAAGVRASASQVRDLGSLLAFDVDGVRFTVFPDGRALIEGTEDLARARSLYDRYVGS
jgi:adenylyltransferase/sulfurtransferase